jgi:hypothetical protein
VKQPPDWPFFCKAVVEFRRLRRRQDMRFDPELLQEVKGFTGDPQAFGHPSRKHRNLGAVVQQLLYVGGLNSRHVLCARLAPVPLPRAAGKELRVLIRLRFPSTSSRPHETCVICGERF